MQNNQNNHMKSLKSVKKICNSTGLTLNEMENFIIHYKIQDAIHLCEILRKKIGVELTTEEADILYSNF